MNSIVSGMKWVMLTAGLLTCTMLYAAIAPQTALLGMFGQTLEGPVAEIVVRNWGVLIALIGVLLIYGAFDVAARPLVLAVAALSKTVFLALLLTIGQELLTRQAMLAVVFDSVQVILFVGYLIASRRVVRATV